MENEKKVFAAVVTVPVSVATGETLTSYAGPPLPPVSPACPVDVRFLKPSGCELALYLEEMPYLSPALTPEAESDDPSDLVRRVATVVAAGSCVPPEMVDAVAVELFNFSRDGDMVEEVARRIIAMVLGSRVAAPCKPSP